MNESIYLDHDLVAPLGPLEHDGPNEEWISPFDIPESIRVSTVGQRGILSLQFEYPGGPFTGAVEPLIDSERLVVEIKTARRSGKILDILCSPPIFITDFPVLAKSLDQAALLQKRKSKRFNFSLIARILENWEKFQLPDPGAGRQVPVVPRP